MPAQCIRPADNISKNSLMSSVCLTSLITYFVKNRSASFIIIPCTTDIIREQTLSLLPQSIIFHPGHPRLFFIQICRHLCRLSHFIPTGKYICSKTAYCLNTVSQFIILIRYPVPALPLFRNPAQRISFKLYLAILVFRL